MNFNPPAPRGTGRLQQIHRKRLANDFNPPAPRGTGHHTVDGCEGRGYISIHPPLAGRDGRTRRQPSRMSHFNPPAPRGTGRPYSVITSSDQLFQSTRPSRDGTNQLVTLNTKCEISIHPPLAGRDIVTKFIKQILQQFQSTRPSRDGTAKSDSFTPHFLHISNKTVTYIC